MKGWFNQNYLHGLAAKGIKTSKKKNDKKVKWQLKKYLSEQIPGGLAEGKPDYKFDPEELYKGTQVELEHTDDYEIAKEIAKDHLVEDKNYYDKLARIEGGNNFFFAKKTNGEEVKFYKPPRISKEGRASFIEETIGQELPVPKIVDTVDELMGVRKVPKKQLKKRQQEAQQEIAEFSDEAVKTGRLDENKLYELRQEQERLDRGVTGYQGERLTGKDLNKERVIRVIDRAEDLERKGIRRLD